MYKIYQIYQTGGGKIEMVEFISGGARARARERERLRERQRQTDRETEKRLTDRDCLNQSEKKGRGGGRETE